MPETIEAEVLEIDGRRPAPPPQATQSRSPDRARDAWSSLRGRVVRLDRRWWPLWVLLAIVAVVVLGVIACFAAVVFTVGRILGGIVRFLASPGRSASGGPLVRRGG